MISSSFLSTFLGLDAVVSSLPTQDNFISRGVNKIINNTHLQFSVSAAASMVVDCGYEGAKNAVNSVISLAQNYKEIGKAKTIYNVATAAWSGDLSPLINPAITLVGLGAIDAVLGKEIAKVASIGFTQGVAGLGIYAVTKAVDYGIRHYVFDSESYTEDYVTNIVQATISINSLINAWSGTSSFINKGMDYVNSRVADEIAIHKADFTFINYDGPSADELITIPLESDYQMPGIKHEVVGDNSDLVVIDIL